MKTKIPLNNVNNQKSHFEDIHEEYKKHYYDEFSMAYRERFIYKKMFSGIDLQNLKVAEIACGDGSNSKFIKIEYKPMKIVGYDISEKACAEYRQQVKEKAYVTDLTRDRLPEKEYDLIFVIGGLHHCIADIESTIENIHRSLTENGLLIMVEPNRSFILQFLRDVWYKLDKYFDNSTEGAINHHLLHATFSDKFSKEKLGFNGGIAYFLILNSMIFRLPYFLKKILFVPLFFFEKIYDYLPCRLLHPFFIAQWIKK